MGSPPDDVTRLAEERAAARRRRDFTAADALRQAIADAGWEVLDRPDGFALEAKRRPVVVSVILDERSWPEDARRLAGSLTRHPHPGGDVQLVSAPADAGGFAAARNQALAGALGDVVVVADTSLEVTGPLLATLTGVLGDPTVAVAGPFGLVSADLREYTERTAGDVVAVQGYCLAARRNDLEAVGGYRESFAFYRNADIDLSLRLRSRGGEVRRAVAVGAEHCRRHAHRDWEETGPAEREALSRRNLRRILDRFGDRVADLAVPS